MNLIFQPFKKVLTFPSPLSRSPSYQLAEKKNSKDTTKDIKATGGNETAGKKEAPLADPEPISDISTGQNTSLATNSPTNGNIPRAALTRAQQQQSIQQSNYSGK